MKTKTNHILIVIIILLAVVIIFKLLNKNKEHFIEMFESISSYDNVDLVKNRKGNHKWRKPHNKNLVLEKEIHTSHGVSNSINSLEERDGKLIDYNVPSVDGLQNSKYKSSFLFKYNQCSPDCCPSTYTCDGGCICTTEQQREFIARRGKLLN